MLSYAVLAYQAVIFTTVLASTKAGKWLGRAAASCWVVFTLLNVNDSELLILQLVTTFMAYKLGRWWSRNAYFESYVFSMTDAEFAKVSAYLAKGERNGTLSAKVRQFHNDIRPYLRRRSELSEGAGAGLATSTPQTSTLLEPPRFTDSATAAAALGEPQSVDTAAQRPTSTTPHVDSSGTALLVIALVVVVVGVMLMSAGRSSQENDRPAAVPRAPAVEPIASPSSSSSLQATHKAPRRAVPTEKDLRHCLAFKTTEEIARCAEK